ncbi:MAG TPA: hypothetical protein PLH38_02540 [Clostridia bacterium]|nr:hypothetical protein [Clostridia bacterium]
MSGDLYLLQEECLAELKKPYKAMTQEELESFINNEEYHKFNDPSLTYYIILEVLEQADFHYVLYDVDEKIFEAFGREISEELRMQKFIEYVRWAFEPYDKYASITWMRKYSYVKSFFGTKTKSSFEVDIMKVAINTKQLKNDCETHLVINKDKLFNSIKENISIENLIKLIESGEVTCYSK